MKISQLIKKLQEIQKNNGQDYHVNVLATCNHRGYPLTTWLGAISEIRVNEQYPDQVEIFFTKELQR